MRTRALLILAMTLVGVMALSGVALAAPKTCSNNPCVGTNGADKLKGTPAKNEIRALRGADYITGKLKADELYGNRGQDEVRAGNGRDRVFGQPAAVHMAEEVVLDADVGVHALAGVVKNGHRPNLYGRHGAARGPGIGPHPCRRRCSARAAG